MAMSDAKDGALLPALLNVALPKCLPVDFLASPAGSIPEFSKIHPSFIPLLSAIHEYGSLFRWR